MTLFPAKETALHRRFLGELAFIEQKFQDLYAPYDWKKNCFGWESELALLASREMLFQEESLTTKSFHRALKCFLHSTHDYHVGARFYSTSVASLPFSMKRIAGRLLITAIDRKRMPKRIFPIEIGDELLFFDDVNAIDALDRFQLEEFGVRELASDRSLAEIGFTCRLGLKGEYPFREEMRITTRSRKKEITQSFSIPWKREIDLISEPNWMALKKQLAPPNTETLQRALAQWRLSPHAEWIQKSQSLLQMRGDPNGIGVRESFLPKLGPIIWESGSDAPFQAYIFKGVNKKRIAFLRIPHFSGGSKEIDAFVELINILERRSDAMVLDLQNNPGGIVWYLYAILSMLTKEPLQMGKERKKMTQEDVFFALSTVESLEIVKSDHDAQQLLGEQLWGYPTSYSLVQKLKSYFEELIEEWNEGNMLTQSLYTYGMEAIPPSSRASYSKPILLLINELGFSCADLFAAVLQDNKRALLVGRKTAGAGGAVDRISYPNLYGIAYVSYTSTMGERLDGTPLENLGVIPDVEYSFTERDITDHYRDFLDCIHANLNKILVR